MDKTFLNRILKIVIAQTIVYFGTWFIIYLIMYQKEFLEKLFIPFFSSILIGIILSAYYKLSDNKQLTKIQEQLEEILKELKILNKKKKSKSK